MLETLNDPQMLHSATVHLPVALSILGLPLLLLSIAVPAQHWQFRLITALAYLALIGAAYVGVETGEGARSEVPPTIRTEASDLLEEHEEWAERIWIPAAVTAGLLLFTLIPFKWVQLPYVYRTVLVLALVGSVTCSFVAYRVGHAGGLLVYKHGIGVPQPETEFASPAASDPEEGEEGMESEAPAEDAEDEETVATRDIDMEEAKAVSFKNDVWPIFEQHCLECHGEDEWEMDSEYDMRTVEAMMIPGEKELPVPPLVPGDPDGSSIVKYIIGEYKPIMPKKKDPLSEDDVHTIRMWIAAGAFDDTQVTPMQEEPPAEDAAAPEESAAPAPEPEAAEPMPEPEPEEAPAPEPEPSEETSESEVSVEASQQDVDPDKEALKATESPEEIPTSEAPPQAAPQIADPDSPTIQAPRPKKPQPKVYQLDPRDLDDGRIII